MADQLDMVNAALRRIGAEPITNLTDDVKGVNVANDIYVELRDTTLRSHPWNFATKRVKLTKNAAAPVFEFDFAFDLPSDWLRTISVHSNDAGHGTLLYRMELISATERAIIASSDDVWMRYVSQVTDTALMTPDFRNAMIFAMARDFAIPIASSNTLHQSMAVLAVRFLNQARSTDALGAFPELRPRGSWATSRGGWRSAKDLLSD